MSLKCDATPSSFSNTYRKETVNNTTVTRESIDTEHISYSRPHSSTIQNTRSLKQVTAVTVNAKPKVIRNKNTILNYDLLDEKLNDNLFNSIDNVEHHGVS